MIKRRILLFSVFLCLSCTAFAQVYKSTDEEGNVTFSDSPTEDSKAVQVEETNVADPVEVPANTAPTPAPQPKVVKTERAPEAPVARDYDDDDGYNGIRARKIRRHHRRMGHNRK